MTYKELMNEIFKMKPTQQDMDLVYFDKEFNEFIPVDLGYITAATKELDNDHPYFAKVE